MQFKVMSTPPPSTAGIKEEMTTECQGEVKDSECMLVLITNGIEANYVHVNFGPFLKSRPGS